MALKEYPRDTHLDLKKFLYSFGSVVVANDAMAGNPLIERYAQIDTFLNLCLIDCGLAINLIRKIPSILLHVFRNTFSLFKNFSGTPENIIKIYEYYSHRILMDESEFKHFLYEILKAYWDNEDVFKKRNPKEHLFYQLIFEELFKINHSSTFPSTCSYEGAFLGILNIATFYLDFKISKMNNRTFVKALLSLSPAQIILLDEKVVMTDIRNHYRYLRGKEGLINRTYSKSKFKRTLKSNSIIQDIRVIRKRFTISCNKFFTSRISIIEKS